MSGGKDEEEAHDMKRAEPHVRLSVPYGSLEI